MTTFPALAIFFELLIGAYRGKGALVNKPVPRYDWLALWHQFDDQIEPPVCEPIPATAMPEPYRRLLVHGQHMTVTVEAHHGAPVDVRVLARKLDGPWYSRRILLVLQNGGPVVQFGLVRINLDFCTDRVRRRILDEECPLGRILIEHDVLRRIEPTIFFRVSPSPPLVQWFGLEVPQTTYGRQATIHCDQRPAVELLEIVAPEPNPS